ncbi:MAG: formate/nitrite transporter family protein [Leptospirales bacterium]
MYLDSVKILAQVAQKKVAFMNRSKISYIVSAMLAGAYVGLGIVLIFSIGAPIAAAGSVFLKVIMGVSFGIALTLVVFAGSELFTGNNMFLVLGVLKKEATWSSLVKIWGFSWLGNLLGSLALAYLVVYSGAIVHAEGFIEKVASAKMNMPALELFIRGILCNWLVCLALWTASRTKSDATKCILIFWCLFAFISSGYEHSVANMTLLGLSMLLPHSEAISWTGFGNNMLFVTLGNIVGGGLFVGAMYWVATFKEEEPELN